MSQERHEIGGPDILDILLEEHEEPTLEELKSRLDSLQILENEGQDMSEWIQTTQQAIQLKIENEVDQEAKTKSGPVNPL